MATAEQVLNAARTANSIEALLEFTSEDDEVQGCVDSLRVRRHAEQPTHKTELPLTD